MDQNAVDNGSASDLDGGVRFGALFPRSLKWIAIIFILCHGCASGPPPDSRVHSVEIDSTLTHAVLIIENPSGIPIEVLLRRPGLLRQLVIAPRTAVRELVPAGPLVVLWKDGRVELQLRERTRSALRL